MLSERIARTLATFPASARAGGRLHARVGPVIDGLVCTVVACQVGRQVGVGEPHIKETAGVLYHKLCNMPQHLALAMLGTTVVFDLAGVASGGRRFQQLDSEGRTRQLASWKTAPVGVLRDFVAFYEKMGTFVYFCHVEEAGDHMGQDQ